ncbi:hypothetical protein C5467_05630 [Photorhabdus khanii subsp. guanajuatensis]|uniref:Phosphoribosylformylglycinamidine synthase n=1 Tax=Photorhabdus khanii subsp. guanajuatensis TaxID=2100166 RepID=A0A4R4K1A9_9GAMM|nr:hypothetical protein C5467_05630 [Photorhabdus khanii subsp. guanajuatensis]
MKQPGRDFWMKLIHFVFTSLDGRATVMMPHPERVSRTVNNSWHPEAWNEDGPWMRIFRNVRKQLG